MDLDFVNRMKDKLEKERDLIMHSIAEHDGEIKRIITAGESGDEADVASNVIDGTLLTSLSTQDKNKLELIDNALNRIRQGTYGHCLKCNCEIPQARLEAIPYTFLCVKCKSRQEVHH